MTRELHHQPPLQLSLKSEGFTATVVKGECTGKVDACTKDVSRPEDTVFVVLSAVCRTARGFPSHVPFAFLAAPHCSSWICSHYACKPSLNHLLVFVCVREIPVDCIVAYFQAPKFNSQNRSRLLLHHIYESLPVVHASVSYPRDGCVPLRACRPPPPPPCSSSPHIARACSCT